MKIKKIIKLPLLIIAFLIFLYTQNNIIVTHNIKLPSQKIPDSFDGFTIVQISDLHGKVFGKNSSTLISKIRKSSPDIIVITGDLISWGTYNEEDISVLVKALSNIAPVYYITGNQEITSPYLHNLAMTLEDCNVHYLNNSSEVISRSGESILLAGVDDPKYAEMELNASNEETLFAEIQQALETDTGPLYTILLSHRPEQFPLYVFSNIDLTFAGHAHGGQIRLPFIGGLYAPNQGIFPKYTSGRYTKGNSTMIVSRGLGNSSFPQRLFNQPEIVVTRIVKSQK